MSTGTKLLKFATGLFRGSGEVESSMCDEDVSLDSLEPGCTGIVKEAPDDSLLAPLGLRSGKKVKVVCRQVFGGPVVVEVDGRTSAVDRDLCCEIKIAPVEDMHAS